MDWLFSRILFKKHQQECVYTPGKYIMSDMVVIALMDLRSWGGGGGGEGGQSK